MSQRGDGARFRRKHGILGSQPVFTMLPGSRRSEVSRLIDDFSETATLILRYRPDTVVVVPTLPHLRKYIDDFFVGRGINPIVIEQEEEKFDCFSASTAAVAASGTVSLELALTDTPHIIAYKLNFISAWLAKILIKTPYANLINIVLNREVVPELLQEDCEPRLMADALIKLLGQKEARAEQMREFREALIQLGLGDPESPSQKAAQAVLSIIDKKGGRV